MVNFTKEQNEILNSGNWEKSLQVIEDAWNTDYGKIKITDDKKFLFLTTGGWYDNEEIIEKLAFTAFWLFYWRKSERGGKFTFGKGD